MNPAIEILNLWGTRAVHFAWPMLWQSSLLIVLFFAIEWLLRRKVRAGVRYALWLMVLLKLVLPPSLALPTGVGWWLHSGTPPPAPRINSMLLTYGPDLAPALPAEDASVFLPPPRPALSIGAAALVGSAVVSLSLLACMLLRWRRVAREAQQATPAPDWLQMLLDETRRSAGLRRPVRLRLLDKPISPAVCGLLRPVILLPRSLTEQLPSAQLRAVLLHELVHLRRADVWVNCGQALLQLFYWWHPLLWLANARIRRVREEAVDDAVMLALRDDADGYAPTLLEVAKLALQRPVASLGLVGILESQGFLRQRIERLLNFHPPRKAGLSVASALCVLAFGGLALPMGEAPAGTAGSDSTSAGSIAPAQPSPGTNSPEPRMSAADLVQDARLLIEAKQWNEAQAALQQAIKQDPRNEAARFYLHLVQDARDGQTTNQGKAIPASALNTRANPVPTNNDRRRIYGKLESLRLGLVDWNGVPLGEVVGRLSEETRKRDPEGQGIRFSTTENRVTASGIVDPTSGLPIASWPTNSTDLSSISIRIAPALHDVRLADALDAIVAGADRPLKYSVLDSGVVFSPRIGKEPVPLFVRASFKVDDNIFLAGLRSATGLAATSELNSPALLNTLRDFLAKLGVDLSPPKSVFFNDRAGVLMVRATQQDLDIVEKAVQQLNATPPPLVNIEAKLIAVPEELITNDFWTSLGVPCAGHTNSTALLTPVQTAAALKTIKSNPSYRIANEAAATVRAGRQLQILCTGLQSILTNLNPHAFTPPGVSTASNNENGLYLSAKMAFGPTFYMIPYVSNDGCTIRLTVIPNLVEFLGYDEPTNSLTVYVNGKKQKASTPLPRFHVSSLTYSAIIPDGQTLVLGGLTSENVTKLKKKVSGLGDIPLLGGLFRSESTTTEKKRMLLFLTPTLIDSAGNRLNRDHQLKPPPPHKG